MANMNLKGEQIDQAGQEEEEFDTLNVSLSQFNHLFIVMRLGDYDMKKLFETMPHTKLSEDHVITILYNLLCAVHFLHSANVCHRDIKPANILIDTNSNVQICDFGLARIMPKKTELQKKTEKYRKHYQKPVSETSNLAERFSRQELFYNKMGSYLKKSQEERKEENKERDLT